MTKNNTKKNIAPARTSGAAENKTVSTPIFILHHPAPVVHGNIFQNSKICTTLHQWCNGKFFKTLNDFRQTAPPLHQPGGVVQILPSKIAVFTICTICSTPTIEDKNKKYRGGVYRNPLYKGKGWCGVVQTALEAQKWTR